MKSLHAIILWFVAVVSLAAQSLTAPSLQDSLRRETAPQTMPNTTDSPGQEGKEPYPGMEQLLDSRFRPIDNRPLQRLFAPRPGWRPNSTWALVAAVIPGGGQLYNRQYWKVPIVLTLGTALTYAVTWHGTRYREYHAAYRDYMSENPLDHDSWKGLVPPGKDPKDYLDNGNIRSQLQRGNNQYRRDRDFYLIVAGVVYLLSFLDAYVDAEMYTFDISPDLSLAYAPFGGAAAPRAGAGAIGLRCTITF